MKSIIIATVLVAVNVSVLVGAVVFMRYEMQQAKFDAQREAMTRVLMTSFTTNYVIPTGEYEGEFASGVCLDAEASDLAIQYAL